MNAVVPLPVLLPSIPGQRWSCHTCGDCCRRLVGHLFDHERRRLDEQGWAAELGEAAYVRAGRNWVLNKRPDGACVFLDENNLCRIHAKFGESAKPLACRVFPFSLRPTDQGWQASLRFDCPSVTSSTGASLQEYGRFLDELAAELPVGAKPIRPSLLQKGVQAHPEEVDALCRRLLRWLAKDDVPLAHRLTVAARLTAALESAKLAKVRGPRFAELVQVLLRGLAAECQSPPPAPTARQRAVMRQFAFACSEHVSLAELRAGPLARLQTRFRQLRKAKRFLRGRGEIPTMLGATASPTFEAVEQVAPGRADDEAIMNLLTRYVTSRIQTRSVFGEGYYGWPVFRGLGALWLSVVATSWLSRYRAAAAHRTGLTFDDVAKAVGAVDAAATRLPALGTFAERARVAYLFEDDGLARLLAAYWPT